MNPPHILLLLKIILLCVMTYIYVDIKKNGEHGPRQKERTYYTAERQLIEITFTYVRGELVAVLYRKHTDLLDLFTLAV